MRQSFGYLTARFCSDHAADDAGQDDFFPSSFIGMIGADAGQLIVQDVDGVEAMASVSGWASAAV